MKVFLAVVLSVASVSALGSGPYLPSGWRPKGPAFYLPSEVESKPFEKPQEILFQESEASGSEGLREYGPPKVSNDISQGLPDAENDQIFQAIQSSSIQQVESEAVSEEKSIVSEIEALAVTEASEELNSATEVAIEKKAQVELQPILEEKIIAVEPVVVEEEVISTEKAIVEKNVEVVQEEVVEVQKVVSEPIALDKEEVVSEPIVVEEKKEIFSKPFVVEEKEITTAEPIVVEEKEVVIAEPLIEAKDFVPEPVLIEKVESKSIFESQSLDSAVQSEVELTTQIPAEAEESSQANLEEIAEKIVEAEDLDVSTAAPVAIDVINESEVKAEVNEEQANVQVEIQTEAQKVEELKTVVEEVRNVEEGVKIVQEQVQNVGEALVILENEVKAEQIQQSEVNFAEAVSGSLEQAPVAFLEYGPPGFREYGPPQGDELLRTDLLEALVIEPRSNELRRRRFSPKFKIIRKIH
ncbi:probable serine/threonine-protein kinase kinX [Manduca sexta]|uniref:ATP-grasp domain-containing protein n=1 Tax=Manduca sexta TaxID=7130 RepID=A0A922CYC7_MANSE|nr:probable serine/threonine-protein kinase kinX [Manduca sexta]KAG6462576.1 hypothetical protein O3G_MSEX013349 [Manduca sexta]